MPLVLFLTLMVQVVIQTLRLLIPHLLDGFNMLRMEMIGTSETRRSGSGETSSKGFIYYWSGMNNSHYVKGVPIGISSRLQPCVVEVTLVDEHICNVIEAEVQFRFHVCCCSVCSYRSVCT